MKYLKLTKEDITSIVSTQFDDVETINFVDEEYIETEKEQCFEMILTLVDKQTLLYRIEYNYFTQSIKTIRGQHVYELENLALFSYVFNKIREKYNYKL